MFKHINTTKFNKGVHQTSWLCLLVLLPVLTSLLCLQECCYKHELKIGVSDEKMDITTVSISKFRVK